MMVFLRVLRFRSRVSCISWLMRLSLSYIPLPVFRYLHHRGPFLFGKLLHLQRKTSRLAADQLHGAVHVFQEIAPVAPFQLAENRLDDDERHFAQGLEGLVVVDALLQIHLGNSPEAAALEDFDEQKAELTDQIALRMASESL